ENISRRMANDALFPAVYSAQIVPGAGRDTYPARHPGLRPGTAWSDSASSKVRRPHSPIWKPRDALRVRVGILRDFRQDARSQTRPVTVRPALQPFLQYRQP